MSGVDERNNEFFITLIWCGISRTSIALCLRCGDNALYDVQTYRKYADFMARSRRRAAPPDATPGKDVVTTTAELESLVAKLHGAEFLLQPPRFCAARSHYSASTPCSRNTWPTLTWNL